MKLPKGEVWLVLAGCGAGRVRSVRVSQGIDGVSEDAPVYTELPAKIGGKNTVSIFIYPFLTFYISLFCIILFCYKVTGGKKGMGLSDDDMPSM